MPTEPEIVGCRHEQLFTIAQLALWAGDLTAAEEILTQLILDFRSRDSTELFRRSDPVFASSEFQLRQLKRRKTEFLLLAEKAEFESSDSEVISGRFISNNEKIVGLLTPTSTRRFEFRVYLRDLTYETDFYRRVSELIEEQRDAELVKASPPDSQSQGDPMIAATGGTYAVFVPEQRVVIEGYCDEFCTFEATLTFLDSPSVESVHEAASFLIESISPALPNERKRK